MTRHTIETTWPEALSIGEAHRRTLAALQDFGFNADNTLFVSSICRDEINQRVLQPFTDYWGNSFTLGGLAGLPTGGLTSFQAALAHVPKNGKMIIFCGPHIGLHDGNIGVVLRAGMESESFCCGALVMVQQGMEPNRGSGLDIEFEHLHTSLSYLKGARLAQITDAARKIIQDRMQALMATVSPQTEVAKIVATSINSGVDNSDHILIHSAEIWHHGRKTRDWTDLVRQQRED